MANYSLSALAEDDLFAIITYGVRQWGLAQANSYYDALLRQLDRIAEDPTRFPTVDHIHPDLRRCVFGSHAIYFRIEEGTISIRAIQRSQSVGRIR